MTPANSLVGEAWDANAEHWDSRMGDEGNDFFKNGWRPLLRNLSHYLSQSFAAIRMSAFSGLNEGCRGERK